MADNDSTDASGTFPCCAGPSVEQGGCLSVTNGFLMNYFSMVVVGQQIPLVTSVRLLSLRHAVALFVDSVAVVGLASLLLLPLSLVTTPLLRGLHGIHTTSAALQLGEACEDNRLEDDAVSLACPWQLLAKTEGVVEYLCSLLLALALRAVDLPTRDQTGVRTVVYSDHSRLTSRSGVG
jgi:hypothetical protein